MLQRPTPCTQLQAVFSRSPLLLGREALQKLAVIRNPRQALGVDVIERVRQRHLAIAVVMAVGFAIGGDIDQLGPFALSENASSSRPANLSPFFSSRSKATACEIGPS